MNSQTSCRTVVLLSGSGSNLQTLIDGQQQGALAINICAVISNRADAYGLVRAAEAGIPNQWLDHRSYTSRDSFDRQLLIKIDSHKPDLVILAGFMRVLTAFFVRHYRGRMLNIHPSLLPKYPGLNTYKRVLDAGEKRHGATVHFVTEKLDGGPAVIQAAIPIFQADTTHSLKQRIQQQEHRIYPMAVNWFASGRLKMVSDTEVSLDDKILPDCGHQINDD